MWLMKNKPKAHKHANVAQILKITIVFPGFKMKRKKISETFYWKLKTYTINFSLLQWIKTKTTTVAWGISIFKC